MKGEALPHADHVSRIIKRQEVDKTVQPSAFLLRKDAEGVYEDGVSVNWIEHFAGRAKHLALREILAAARQKRTVRSNQKMAVVQCGPACAHVRSKCEASIEILHDPEEVPPYDHPDPSHALVVRIPPGLEMEVAEHLAEAVSEVVDISALEALPAEGAIPGASQTTVSPAT